MIGMLHKGSTPGVSYSNPAMQELLKNAQRPTAVTLGVGHQQAVHVQSRRQVGVISGKLARAAPVNLSSAMSGKRPTFAACSRRPASSSQLGLSCTHQDY